MQVTSFRKIAYTCKPKTSDDMSSAATHLRLLPKRGNLGQGYPARDLRYSALIVLCNGCLILTFSHAKVNNGNIKRL